MNNKLIYVFICMTILLLFFGIGTKIFIDKVSDRVIYKLQKEYSPSPYGPGLDPDKIDITKIRSAY